MAISDLSEVAEGCRVGNIDLDARSRMRDERQGLRQRGRFQPRERELNVGGGERIMSLAAGSVLALFGIRQRGTSGGLAAGLGAALLHRGATGRCYLYDALGIDTARTRGKEARPEEYFDRGIHVEQTFTIRKHAQDLYRFWRNFENLPRFMRHLESVKVLDERRSHWVATAPGIAGGTVEWDAEIINDEPNTVIAWRSLEGADVDNAGSVRFVPASGERGTEVRVVIDYIPPAGQIGRMIAKLFGQEPDQQVKEDLRNFKRLMEAGELPTIQGQPRGNCAGAGTRHQGI